MPNFGAVAKLSVEFTYSLIIVVVTAIAVYRIQFHLVTLGKDLLKLLIPANSVYR